MSPWNLNFLTKSPSLERAVTTTNITTMSAVKPISLREDKFKAALCVRPVGSK
jgi:hypothetical protein